MLRPALASCKGKRGWQFVNASETVGTLIVPLVSPTPGRYSWGIWNDAPRHYEKLVVLLSVQNNPLGMVVGNFSLDNATEALDFARDMAKSFAVPVHTFCPASSSTRFEGPPLGPVAPRSRTSAQRMGSRLAAGVPRWHRPVVRVPQALG